MHAVVNQFRLAANVDPLVFSSMGDVVPEMRAMAEFAGAQVIQTSAREVVLINFADSPETLDHVATEVGSPWMREGVPLLAAPPDRHVGPVLVSG